MSTEQPKPLTGYRETQETKKEVTVDPKKFQEELSKVKESEESQQRDKRNLKKSEEEGEEDELAAKKNLIKASGALFAMFMKESVSDLLTPQTPQNVRGSQAPELSSQFTIEHDDSLGSELPQEPSFEQQTISATKASEPPPVYAPLPTFTQNIQTPVEEKEQSFSQPQGSQPLLQPQETQAPATPFPVIENAPLAQSESQEQQEPTSPTRVEKKEKEKDTSLLGKEKKTKAHALKEAKEKTPEIHLEKREKPPVIAEKIIKEEKKEPIKKIEPQPTHEKEKPLGIKAHENVQMNGKVEKKEGKEEIEPKEAPAVIISAAVEKKPEIKTKEAIATESLEQPKIKTEKQASDDSSKKEKDQEKEKESAASVTPTPQLTTFTPPPTPPAPAYANLSPQVFELFERMVGLISLQEGKGVTTTTVTINMKNSIFDGTQIIIDHYVTAPNALNITIAGNPRAQEMINSNMTNLAASFEASKLSYQVNLKRPILLDEYQTFKRKEKVGAENEEEEQPQQE